MRDEDGEVVHEAVSEEVAMRNQDDTVGSEDELIQEACRELTTCYEGPTEYWTSESMPASPGDTSDSSDNQSARHRDDDKVCSKANKTWLRRRSSRGPPLTFSPGGYGAVFLGDSDLTRLVPPKETLGTIMSQDEIPPMPSMLSDEEGMAEPEELSEVDENDMSEMSDSISITTAASTDDEHQLGGRHRSKIGARALAYSSESSCDNSSGPPNREAAVPKGTVQIHEETEANKVSKEAVKAWEEHRKALRAARRKGRTTYGEYLRAQADPDLMSQMVKRVTGRSQIAA